MTQPAVDPPVVEPAVVPPVTTPPVVEPPVAEPPVGTVYDAEYVKSLRDEAAARRTALRESEKEKAALEARLKELEDAKLSDTDRTAKELKEARERIAQIDATEAVRQGAVRDAQLEADVVKVSIKPELKIQDPDAAFRLLDRSKLTFDDETGRATNIEAVLTDLIKEKPWLVAPEGSPTPVVPSTGSASPPRGSSGGDTPPTRAEIEAASEEQINEWWEKGLLTKALEAGSIA